MERLQTPSVEVIDLADVLRSIRNGWKIVVGCVVAGLAIAIAILMFVPPSFAGSASLIVKAPSAGGGSSLASAIAAMSEVGGGGGGGGLPSMQPGVETEIEILQSRALAERVVDSLRLQAQVTTPRSVPSINAFSSVELTVASFRRRLYTFTPESADRYRFKAEADSGTAQVGQPAKLAIGSVTIAPTAPRTAFKVVFRDREDAITFLTERIKFGKAKTDVAHFTYTGTDSISAAAVPNLLMSLYLDRRKGIDRGTNQRRAEFLALKVDSVGEALTGAERQLRAQRESTGLLDPMVTGRTELETENRLRQQLTEIQVQEGALQQLVTQIKDGTASPRQLASYPQYLGSGPINGIVGNLIGVETERQALLGTVTEEDERVKALATRAQRLEAQLLPLAQATLTALASQRSTIQQRLQVAQQTLVGVPRAAESYDRLEREILDRARIYAGLQTQLVDARLAAIGEGGDVRTLDRAVEPKKPSSPKPGITLAGGMGAGLFLGLTLAALMGVIGGRMYDPEDVERRTGLPAVRLEAQSPLLVGGAYSQTIVVAPISARASARPVAERLIETALSRSMTATLLDLTATATSLPAPVITGESAALITRTNAPLAFDANAAIRKLRETHDLVVIQLPALASREAAAILDDTKPVLLVAPERRIERATLQSAVDILRRVGAPCAGVVLNGDDRRRQRA